MTDPRDLATKSEFAGAIGVSQGRLSQWIAEGVLDGCLVGEGVRALIDVPRARRQLGDRLVNSKADLEALAGLEDGAGTVEQQLKKLRLKAAERADRQAEIDERLRAGELVVDAAAKAETAKLLGRIFGTLAGWPKQLAQEIATACKVSARDVEFIADRSWRAICNKVADQVTVAASAMPELVTYDTETGQVVAGETYADDYNTERE